MLGYLFCSHRNLDASGESLWGIINPEIKETIGKDQVSEALHKIAAYAVDVPEKY